MGLGCFYAHSPQELRLVPAQAMAMNPMAMMMSHIGAEKKKKKERKEKKDKKEKKEGRMRAWTESEASGEEGSIQKKPRPEFNDDDL